MKIALIGNMNNNNFAMMRYFRELNEDAHLLLFANDGCNTLEHFKIEYDTWDIDKWLPFIHQTEIINGSFSVFGNPERIISPYQPLCYLKYIIKTIFRQANRKILPPTDEYLRHVFADYDAYIGSGLSPAILNRIGLSLDIFYPYSTGVEFLGTPEFLKEMRSKGRLKRMSLQKIAQAQKEGIRKARLCLNAEMSLTKKNLDRIGVTSIPLFIPMVYNHESPKIEHYSRKLIEIMEKLTLYDFKIISHARHMWSNSENYKSEEWHEISKNNDWLFRSYAKFIKMGLLKNPILILFDYGPDVEHSKKLIIELGIQKNVLWLARMPRREIMQIISCCDVGVGEFASHLWGGTAWEVLSCGKPLLQSFVFGEGGFERIFGFPPPPMLSVEGPKCITKHLIDMAENPSKREAMGREASKWFNRYNGIGLAKQWLGLLKNDGIAKNPEH